MATIGLNVIVVVVVIRVVRVGPSRIDLPNNGGTRVVGTVRTSVPSL